MILLLGLVAAWPVAHYAWVQNAGVSPWKFFGWAMYTTPRFQAQFEFRAIDDGSGAEAESGRLLRYPRRRPEARRALAAYRQAELAWLRQTDPSGLARAVFAAYPRVRQLELKRHLYRYDAETGRPVRETDVRVFDRRSL